MTKARSEYIYQLTGKIKNKNKRNSKVKKYQGTYFWQLNVEIENKPQIEKIMVFLLTLENKTVWEEIENTDYLDKKYTFFCKNYQGSYRLINWEELPSNLSSLPSKGKELKDNHEQKT